jgi:hypothetical protein
MGSGIGDTWQHSENVLAIGTYRQAEVRRRRGYGRKAAIPMSKAHPTAGE